MLISGTQWRSGVKLTLTLVTLCIGCHGNHVPYKHLTLDDNDLVVDKIVSFETDKEENPNVVKIVTTDFSNDNTRHPSRRHPTRQHRHDNEVNNEVENEVKTNLMDIIEELRSEIRQLKSSRLHEELRNEIQQLKDSQYTDRMTITDLNEKVEHYHDESVISTAEVVQIRQLVTENYDKTSMLEEISQDNSLLLESFTMFQKDANREIRRFKEYKERAAKRFHQLTNQVEKCQKSIEQFDVDLRNLTQDLNNSHTQHDRLTSELHSLRDLTITIQSDLNVTTNNLTSCCNTQHKLTNQIKELKYSMANEKLRNPSNQKPVSSKLTNHIEVLNFGSGDVTHEEYLAQLEEETNSVEGGSYYSYTHHGSGETVNEGSGEFGSGDTSLPPLIDDLRNYIHKDVFFAEKMKWEGNFMDLSQQYDNLTQFMEELETRVKSIQLGNFMQNLQDSLLNFTQNMITMDQWQTSSNNIVNSTLYNQDQIVKLTNMVIENADKVADLNWRVANGDLLSTQQYNVLKRYVIQLNNSVEDIKEQMALSERRQQNGFNPHRQYQATYYNYQTGYNVPDNQFEDQSNGNQKDTLEILKSQLDDIGLQIVFNQNRLGNLEVKMLNESLYSCRKYNVDTYQDTQLTNQEAAIKSNANSIMLTHELVKELDYTVKSVYSQMRSNERKWKVTSGNLDSLRGVIPAVVRLKTEMDNILYTLPTDCDDYYKRGFRKSGVYVIHPYTASNSIQVMCHMTDSDHVTDTGHVTEDHMTQNGGWTVIQQRFDGSVDFKKNWTDYMLGFGHVESEYWLGNYYINLLTSHRNYSLEIDLVDVNDVVWTAKYEEFSVNLPNTEYTLHVSGYSGNASDAMGYITNMGFSTMDRDNDASSTNCAYYYESGWWFKHCQTLNLNGRYNIGFTWFNHNTYDWLRLKSSVMKIKPHSTL